MAAANDKNEVTAASANHDVTADVPDATALTQKNNHNSAGALSMTVAQLAAHLGGVGRAQLAWDCYRIGVDPARLFATDASDADLEDASSDKKDADFYNAEERASIQRLLPSRRRTQHLGADALERLAQLHSSFHNHRVDGGLARLVLISQSSSATKLLLQLNDNYQVETVILPWTPARSTLCVSSQVGCRQGALCQFCC